MWRGRRGAGLVSSPGAVSDEHNRDASRSSTSCTSGAAEAAPLASCGKRPRRRSRRPTPTEPMRRIDSDGTFAERVLAFADVER